MQYFTGSSESFNHHLVSQNLCNTSVDMFQCIATNCILCRNASHGMVMKRQQNQKQGGYCCEFNYGINWIWHGDSSEIWDKNTTSIALKMVKFHKMMLNKISTTRVVYILNFTATHAITNTNRIVTKFLPYKIAKKCQKLTCIEKIGLHS